MEQEFYTLNALPFAKQQCKKADSCAEGTKNLKYHNDMVHKQTDVVVADDGVITIIVSKTTSHCVGAVQMREESVGIISAKCFRKITVRQRYVDPLFQSSPKSFIDIPWKVGRCKNNHHLCRIFVLSRCSSHSYSPTTLNLNST